ncbi:MAG TPA: AAA family ATPase, partial [Thermodesulfovibrionia bacterium]|nr:AAA family ATPase [Thermodesulfovibrionia bacterium]
TMDVFAADLWGVSQQSGPEVYKDADTFFAKTYLTQGLQNLLDVVEKRLNGNGGDPVIQIQTPFGGGKTHALIALYHKAKQWKAKTVVIVGDKLKTGSKAEDFTTLWATIEEQLTGSVTKFNPVIPPGGEQLKELLEDNMPVLILIDEIIPYLNIADAVKVEKSTLTTLTLTFLQTLTNVVSETIGLCMVFTTTPSNPYNKSQRGDELVTQLKNIAGRREIIKTPVQDQEIAKIIRTRLFSHVKEKEVKQEAAQFVEYIEKEGLIPEGIQPGQYRDRFIDSYPFMPEVLDVLYHRWGSFPNFQRTRGALRLLSLVIDRLKSTNNQYISLADFNLADQELRQELIKHIGEEYNSVLAQDITDVNACSKRVDISLGSAFQSMKLGTRTATTVFLYSFSGGKERGATLNEIKLSSTTIENPSSLIDTAIQQILSKLFYIQHFGGKYFFTNQPNINRILHTEMANVSDQEINEKEEALLRSSIKSGKFKVCLWEEKSENIADTAELKLVILKHKDEELMKKILKIKGQTPRVNCNTIFFLYPMESEFAGFKSDVKQVKARENIIKNPHFNLSEEQKKAIKKELDSISSGLKESIKRLYRLISIPDKDGIRDSDLGMPTSGIDRGIDMEVYEKLRQDNEILENIAPLVIKEKYLKGKDYVLTNQLYQSFYTTPGVARPINKTVIESGITEGVLTGTFGLGEIEDNKPICRYFKENPIIALDGNEAIIREEICKEQKSEEQKPEEKKAETPTGTEYKHKDNEHKDNANEQKEGTKKPESQYKESIMLRFLIPKGKVSNIMGVMNFLQSKFETLEIELIASEGRISVHDYEEKIKEAFSQMGIRLED